MHGKIPALPKPLPADTKRQRMWKGMRVMRIFTTADVEATSEVCKEHVKKYVRLLARAGYLKLLKACVHGQTNGHATWQLVRDSGPLAPRVLRGRIYDANQAKPDPALVERHASEIFMAMRELIAELDLRGASPRLREIVARGDRLIDKAEGRP